jgi:hypothetical protein
VVIKSEFGIYSVLEKHLRKTADPLTCVDLFQKADVQKFAANANKVSDYLGHMWRRGLLDRFYAPRTSTSMARYAYAWKEEPAEAAPQKVATVASPTTKSKLEVLEKDGVIELRLGKLIITIRST